MTRERSRSGHGESQHCVAPERMLPKDDASHDKTCQGGSSLKRMTDVTPAPAVSGLSLAIMLESKFSVLPGTPQNPARVSL